MRVDVRRERDAIAALRAEWATLDNPARIQSLARRHLQLRPADASQFDPLQGLPEKPPVVVQPQAADAIASMIENSETAADRQRAGQAQENDREAIGGHGRANARRHAGSRRGLRRAARSAARRTLAAAHAADAALRAQRRPQRQGARPHRARHSRLRRGLCRHRRPAGDVRGGAGKPFRAARRGARRGRDRAPRHPRPQRPDSRNRRPHAVAVRRAAPDDRRRRGDRASDRGAAGPRRQRGARAARLHAAASSGSSARSPPSSGRKSTGSACRAWASSPRTSASIRTAPRSRT